jgi:MFS transporter, SP family, sugar:H+ symporter
MWGQLSGINFVIYFGVVFFTSLQTSLSPFLIGIVITMVNVLSTIISFWTLERFGRRPVLLTGYAGMAVSQIGVAISGSIGMDSDVGKKVTVAFVCLYTAFFAGCAGPADFGE